jgi:CDP-diacylglycerol---glycerol-3-phosphate 3-phosphatidyltransferase
MNLPNQLTMARMVLVPLFVIFMSFENTWCYLTAYIIFAVATATDYIDGRIARSRQLVTNFGKLMDPVADKILMTAGFIMMLGVPSLHVPAWAIIAIIAREFLITGARSIAAGEGSVIAANNWGKAKTFLQAGYVFLFLGLAVVYRLLTPLDADWLPDFGSVLYFTSYWAGVAVALFTLWSGVQFALLNWRNLKLGDT